MDSSPFHAPDVVAPLVEADHAAARQVALDLNLGGWNEKIAGRTGLPSPRPVPRDMTVLAGQFTGKDLVSNLGQKIWLSHETRLLLVQEFTAISSSRRLHSSRLSGRCPRKSGAV